MIKEIGYKGITRLPSDRNSFEGELEEAINVINVAGELRPYISPSVIGIIDGELLFVHKNSGYEHLIYNNGGTVKAYDYNNGTLIIISSLTNLYGEEIRKIESIGNTLIILTDKDIHYFLWKNYSYKYLGTELPFPVINFDQQPATTFSDGSTIDKIWSVTLSNHAANIAKLVDMQGYYFPSWAIQVAGQIFKKIIEGLPSVDIEFENAVKGPLHVFLEKLSKEGLHVYPFFIRYALRMYDGSLSKHSMPILILPSKFMAFQVGIINPSTDNKIGYQFERISKLVYSHAALNGLNSYTDIVQSIDVFMSEPIYTYIYEGHFNGVYGTNYWNSDPDSPDKLIGGITKSKEDVLDQISSTGNFYHIHSISIDDLNTAVSNKEIKVENINTLASRELMKDDYLSHDSLMADNCYAYNNKLHLSGVKRDSFAGFKIQDLRCYYHKTSGEATYNVGKRAFIFYPGKCKNLLLSAGSSGSYREKFIWLKEHSQLNGCFYLDPDLNDIGVNDVSPATTTFFDVTVAFGKQSSVIDEPNKLFISASQNPFHFPVESRITLPVSNIIAMCSNTEAISQGQFGQFPLYVLTDDGVWALEVNPEGKYMARQPVSRDVCINQNILQMDKHIGFITEKGLMILSGTQSECITDIIRENNIRASKIPVSSFLDATGSTPFAQIYNTDNIESFLKDCALAYEYINGKGRVFIINKNYPYSYVFDIETKSWSKIQSDFIRAVNNYPDCYVQNKKGQILNLSSLPVSEEQKKCMFVTRALSHSDCLFSINKLAHRGILKKELNTVIYGSRDGIDYTPVASSKKKLLSVRGAPFRYFKIAVIADLFPTDAISGCSIEINERYTNRLR